MSESLAANTAIFALASILIWKAGSSLSFCLNAIADKTGMGKAFAGALFLGGATSLPEIATSATAAWSGLAQLAGSNLLGGVAMQLAVLVFIDVFALKNKALTSMTPKAALLMQGVILAAMGAMAAGAIAASETVSFGHAGLWPAVLFLFYLAALRATHRYEKNPQWEAVSPAAHPTGAPKGEAKSGYQKYGVWQLWRRFAVLALIVLVGGWAATKSAENIIVAADLDQNIVGATLLALATSLPEVSVSWAAVKIGSPSMAVAGIFGTNALEVALLFLADLFYRDGPLMNELENDSIFLAALGVVMTAVYTWGILERRDKTYARMGADSLAILVLYALGMWVYSMI